MSPGLFVKLVVTLVCISQASELRAAVKAEGDLAAQPPE